MRVPDAAEILRIWEDGARATATQRSANLLAAVFPDLPPAELAGVNVGRRDAWLIALRQAMIGDAASGYAVCPRCQEAVEIEFDVSRLRIPEPETVESRLSIDGYVIDYRPIAIRDLLRLGWSQDVEAARMALVQAAVRGAWKNGRLVDARELPEAVIEALGEAVRERDPQSEIAIRLGCPACGHSWRVHFDITHFFYKELATRARRTLDEVRQLAKGYGWSESDILGMTPVRRKAYLDLLES